MIQRQSLNLEFFLQSKTLPNSINRIPNNLINPLSRPFYPLHKLNNFFLLPRLHPYLHIQPSILLHRDFMWIAPVFYDFFEGLFFCE